MMARMVVKQRPAEWQSQQMAICRQEQEHAVDVCCPLRGNDTDSSDAPNALKAWPRPPQVPQSLVTHRNPLSLRSSLQQRCLRLVSTPRPACSRNSLTHFSFQLFS